MKTEHRPWGYFTVLLTDSNMQIKKLMVNPGKRLSLQSHEFRAEHWFFVSGTGFVELDSKVLKVGPGLSVDVGIGTKHRIACDSSEPLIFIEIQTGESFDENDIKRFDDDFGRA